MTQTSKCKIFGHKPDFTMLKHDVDANSHDTLCMACGIQMYIHDEHCFRAVAKWYVFGTTSHTSRYCNLPDNFLYDSNQ